MTTPAARPSTLRSRARRGAVVVATVIVLLSGCAAQQPGEPASSAASAPAAPPAVSAPSAATQPPAATQAPTPTPAPLPVGLPPASVAIDAIGLEEPLIDLGLQPDGSMEVPTDFDDVGWFTGGGRPGGVGPTVIAAHVDSTSGPAVFARLGELVPGDSVRVSDVTGQVFDYVVTRVGDYAKADFPTTEVFGAVPTDELRLITCTGLFDRSIGHYEDNRVVFAVPA